MTLEQWIEENREKEIEVKNNTIYVKPKATKYSYLDAFGEIWDYEGSIENESYRLRKRVGNVFPTRKEALEARESLRLLNVLRTKGGREYDKSRKNYSIRYSSVIDDLDVFEEQVQLIPLSGGIYFDSEEKALEALDAIKKESREFMVLTIGKDY